MHLHTPDRVVCVISMKCILVDSLKLQFNYGLIIIRYFWTSLEWQDSSQSYYTHLYKWMKTMGIYLEITFCYPVSNECYFDNIVTNYFLCWNEICHAFLRFLRLCLYNLHNIALIGFSNINLYVWGLSNNNPFQKCIWSMRSSCMWIEVRQMS